MPNGKDNSQAQPKETSQQINLKTQLTTVTKFSKIVALGLFVLLPFLGFSYGVKYQRKMQVCPDIVPTKEENSAKTVAPMKNNGAEEDTGTSQEEKYPSSAEKYGETETIPSQQEQSISSLTNPPYKITDYEIDNCILYVEVNNVVKLNAGRVTQKPLGCPDTIQGKISPSGKYMVFESRAGGADPSIMIYSADADTNGLKQFYVYGSSTVFDYDFLPGDILAVMNGYPGIYDEQWVTVYDIETIYGNFEENTQENYFEIDRTAGYVKDLPLENFGVDYTQMDISDGNLNARTGNAEMYTAFSPQEYGFGN